MAKRSLETKTQSMQEHTAEIRVAVPTPTPPDWEQTAPLKLNICHTSQELPGFINLCADQRGTQLFEAAELNIPRGKLDQLLFKRLLDPNLVPQTEQFLLAANAWLKQAGVFYFDLAQDQSHREQTIALFERFGFGNLKPLQNSPANFRALKVRTLREITKKPELSTKPIHAPDDLTQLSVFTLGADQDWAKLRQAAFQASGPICVLNQGCHLVADAQEQFSAYLQADQKLEVLGAHSKVGPDLGSLKYVSHNFLCEHRTARQTDLLVVRRSTLLSAFERGGAPSGSLDLPNLCSLLSGCKTQLIPRPLVQD